jgi:tellurite methyltransferase
MIDDVPSPFVVDWIPRVSALVGPRPRALDVAVGHGRHSTLLARSGFAAFGVDLSFDAVKTAVARARAEALVLRGWCADLTRFGLPVAAFDAVLVTRYLQRDLFPAIRNTLRPGGIAIYETFTVNQRRLGVGPRSPEHLLGEDELREHFEEFDVLFYEEVDAPEAVARIVARRPA